MMTQIDNGRGSMVWSMSKMRLMAFCILVVTALGCAPLQRVAPMPAPTSSVESTRTIPMAESVQLATPTGASSQGTISDEMELEQAKAVAERYWDAQKRSDSTLFKAITPHETMSVVLDWALVTQSNIDYEEASIEPIKNHLQQIILHNNRYIAIQDNTSDLNASIKASEQRVKELEAIAKYAKSIEPNYPTLGWLLQKGYWDSVVPDHIVNSSQYRLMHYTLVADVKFQSRAGTMLHKRTHTELYRMKSDNYDSGWKVLFAAN